MGGDRPHTRAASSLRQQQLLLQQQQCAAQQTDSSFRPSNSSNTHTKFTGSARLGSAAVPDNDDGHEQSDKQTSGLTDKPETRKTSVVSSGRRGVAKRVINSKELHDGDHVTLSLKMNRKKTGDQQTRKSTDDVIVTGRRDKEQIETETETNEASSSKKGKRAILFRQHQSSRLEIGNGSRDSGNEDNLAKSLPSSPSTAADVTLPVTCGSNVGQLFLNRLETGSRGQCVQLSDGSWLTPNEFQTVSGRGNAKDWKRSIRHHDKSLKLLEKMGLLSMFTPPICLCEYCDVQPGDLRPKKNVGDVEQLSNNDDGSASASLIVDRGSDAAENAMNGGRKSPSSPNQRVDRPIGTIQCVDTSIERNQRVDTPVEKNSREHGRTVESITDIKSDNRKKATKSGKHSTGSVRRHDNVDAVVNCGVSELPAASCNDQIQIGMTSCVLVKRTRDGWKAEPKFGRLRDGYLATGKSLVTEIELTDGGTKDTANCRNKTILNVPTFAKPTQDCHSNNSGMSEKEAETSVGVFQESIATNIIQSSVEHINSMDARISNVEQESSLIKARRMEKTSLVMTPGESKLTTVQSQVPGIGTGETSMEITDNKTALDAKYIPLPMSSMLRPPLNEQLCTTPSSSKISIPATAAMATAPCQMKTETELDLCQQQQQQSSCLPSSVLCPSVVLTTRQTLTEKPAKPAADGQKISENLLLGPSTPAAAVYSVSPPYLVMGITLHRLACLSQQSATNSSSSEPQQQRGNRKRKHQNNANVNNLSGVATKRHRRTGSRNRRHVAVDDVSSTTPDCSLQSDVAVDCTSGRSAETGDKPRSGLSLPVDVDGNATRDTFDGRQTYSNLVPTETGNGSWSTGYGMIVDASVSKQREELVFDCHGALDLSVKRSFLPGGSF